MLKIIIIMAETNSFLVDGDDDDVDEDDDHRGLDAFSGFLP